MQHNNVIGKHQATYSFAKNAPPNFWLKDTEKNSFVDSNLENIGNKCFYFFLLLNIKLSLGFKIARLLSIVDFWFKDTWESLCWFKPVAWVAGTDCSEEVFLFCFAFITPVCRTLVKLQYSIKSTLFAHFSTIVFNEVNIFLLWFFYLLWHMEFLSNLNQLIQMLCFNQDRKIKGSETDETKSLKENLRQEGGPETPGDFITETWGRRRSH